MGLVKAGIGAVGGVLADQWRDYYYCESMPSDVLVVRGSRRVGADGSNAKGDSDIISNGSIINVNAGQHMILVDGGKVVEMTSEPGEFLVSNSSEASVFFGEFGDNARKVAGQAWERFGFGGDAPKGHRVYYLNAKEIMDNHYEPAYPVPVRVEDKNVGLGIDVSVKCDVVYSYRISDPETFYRRVCGNVQGCYYADALLPQMNAEIATALAPALARVSGSGARPSDLPAHAQEFGEALRAILSELWLQKRGIEVVSFAIDSLYVTDVDRRLLRDTQMTAVFRDSIMAGAELAKARADAMRTASDNSAGGMGLFAALGTSGANFSNLYHSGQWTCSCGAKNQGNYCAECGSARPR